MKHLEIPRIVLDTNVLLVCISNKSPYNWIFKKLIRNEIQICVTTEILLEYTEIIERKMESKASQAFLRVFDNLDGVNYIQTYFEFNLLKDPDDNKFVNCAIASKADYIVSKDKDFNILKKISFPNVEVIGIEAFKKESH